MNTGLRRSCFAHFLQREEAACSYHALKIITHYFPATLLPYIDREGEWTIAQALKKVPLELHNAFLALTQRLSKDGLLVPVAYDERNYLKKVQAQVCTDGRIRVMVLHLAGHCNLACNYCFIDGGKIQGHASIQMAPEIAVAALEILGRTLQSKPIAPGTAAPSIVLYGGEPLLNKRVMRTILQHAVALQNLGRLPRNLAKVLITNGTLIDRATAALLKDYNVSVSLSLDGPQEIHDANRVHHGGRGSFAATMAGYHLLREVGIRPSIACVLAPGSLPNVEHILRFFVEELGVKAVGMNHVSILPERGYSYSEDYERNFAEAVLFGQELILRYSDVYERRMSHKLNCFLDRRILRADCTGCGEQVAVSPTGDIAICQGYVSDRTRHHIGHVLDGSLDLNASPVVAEWARRSPLTMEACYDCLALSTCGGGCPRNAETLHGSIWAADTAFCHFARRATEWMIWKKRDAGKQARMTIS